MHQWWLYSEATVAVRPQGVAVKVVNTKFKKQPQISSHPAESLLLGHVIFQQTENISLPPHRLRKKMTGRWFSNTLCQSLPSSQLSLTQILVYRIWQEEYGISFLQKSGEITDKVTFRAGDVLQIYLPRWRLIEVCSPQKFQTSWLQNKQSATAHDTVQ